jgi:gliding motility-associated-like protein
MRHFLLILMLIGIERITIAQRVVIENLLFNSPTNVVRLDFSDGIPQVSYLNVGSNEPEAACITHIEDGKGNILFWLTGDLLFDKNNMRVASDHLADGPPMRSVFSSEAPLFRSSSFGYYHSVFVDTMAYVTNCSILMAGTLEFDNENRIKRGNWYFGSAGGINNGQGLEFIRKPCTDDYWYVHNDCDKGLSLRSITHDSWYSGGGLLYEFQYPPRNAAAGELDYQNGKLGYALGNAKKIIVGDFDPVEGKMANAKEIDIPVFHGCYGLEFSADGTKVYVTDTDNYDSINHVYWPNLFRYDLITGTIDSWTIENNGLDCGSTKVRGLGQIEIGKDLNLYTPHIGGCQISVIKNPSSATPEFDLIDVNSILSLGISDNVKSDFLLKNSKITTLGDTVICAGEVIKLYTAKQYDWIHYTWLKDNKVIPGSNSLELTVTEPGIYTVKIGSQYDECLNSSSITITPKIPLDLGPDIKTCDEHVRLESGHPELDHLWSDGTVASYIDVFESGTIWLALDNGNCITTDTLSVNILPYKAPFVPNVITPGEDGFNDYFTIALGQESKIDLQIYDRWGSLVYHNDDYKNTWRADNVSSGIYFYNMKVDHPCTLNLFKGIISVLK